MLEPVRILHVFGGLNRGGAESRTMDLYRHMDRERVQFDFLVHTQEKGHFEEEIQELGGRIYRVPRFRLYNYFIYRKAMKLFFAAHHEFQCVQGHMTSTAAIYLPIAKAAGVPMTAAHARSAGVDKGMKGKLTRLMRLNLSHKADYLFACSALAGESVFGRKAVEAGKTIYIPNAIDASPFRYNSRVREKLREELRLADQFVVGHVGRFDYAKNHEYLIRIFYEIQDTYQNARLILLGDGAGMETIRKTAGAMGIYNKVLFLGNKSNIQDYYQVMDYFVFPSRFEGLPGTVIEAQAAGLKCLISDTIAEEVLISDLVRSHSIQAEPREWARIVLQTAGYPRNDMVDTVVAQGFDVSAQARKMADFYRSGDPGCLSRAAAVNKESK